MTAGRLINSLCYLVSGIAIFVVAASNRAGASNGLITVLVGVAACGYGLYVMLSRGSYWVGALSYIIPVALVAYLIAR